MNVNKGLYKLIIGFLSSLLAFNLAAEVTKDAETLNIIAKMKSGQVETNDAIFNFSSPNILLQEIISKADANEAWAQYAWADISNFCVIATENAIDSSAEYVDPEIVIPLLEKELAKKSDPNKQRILDLLKLGRTDIVEIKSAKKLENIEYSFEFKKKCNALETTFLSENEWRELYKRSASNGFGASNIISSYFSLAEEINVDDGRIRL